ncbi:MAG: hypothetical protein RLY31_330 [Bacteroidota bacterium]|jgi:peptide deformylase
MILPIYAYGQSVLKKVATDIGPDYPDLPALVSNMWETMYAADGVGLAAPQIGLPIRLFVVDTFPREADGTTQERKETPIRQVFVNARILEESGTPWTFEEGCLSIPDIRGDVERPPVIRIRYQDEHFVEHESVFDGLNARVIQHEYDHIEGVLFVEHLKPIKKQLIRRRLDKIRAGMVRAEYRMKFARLR